MLINAIDDRGSEIMHRTIELFIYNDIENLRKKNLVKEFEKRYEYSEISLDKEEKNKYRKKYFFSEEKMDLNKVYQEQQKFEEYVDLKDNIVFIEKEIEDAVAYILNYSWGFEEYGNYLDREELEPYIYPCEECNVFDTKEVIYAKPYVTEDLKTSYGIYAIDGGEEQILTPKLYEYLIENGIEKKYFKPVYITKENIIGRAFSKFKPMNKLFTYYLNLNANVLPENSVKGGYGEVREVCRKCGRINVYYTMDDFSKPVIPWTITEKGVENLKDVNTMYEYYSNSKITIINKKMYNLLKEKVANFSDHITPIFLI